MSLEDFNLAGIPLAKRGERPKTNDEALADLWNEYDNIVNILESYRKTILNLEDDFQKGHYGLLEKGRRKNEIENVKAEATLLERERLPIIVSMLAQHGKKAPVNEQGIFSSHSPRNPRRAA